MQSEKKIEKYLFNLKKLLGQGSYASVYLGRVIETNQEVAVKVIDKRIFANSYNLKNIHCEIQIMKKVYHHNIVKLHDIYQTANNIYLVTERCDIDLYHFLENKKKIVEEQAVHYLKQIIDGVKYLNSQGIIHRDLKPANILIKNKQCKISDFGFAKNLENQNTIMRSIVGTPLYMSPQLLKKTKYTNKSDLWSIGLIYYEMLHGRTPWPANNQIQLIHAIYSQRICYSKAISQKSKDFIHRCLQIDQDDRMSWEEAFDHPIIVQKEVNQQILTQKLMKGVFPSPKELNNSKISENGSKYFSKKSQTSKNTSIILKPSTTPQKVALNHQNNSNLTNIHVNHTNKENNIKRINIQCQVSPSMKRIGQKTQNFSRTPKTKNKSEIKLKTIEALTPKSSSNNISHRLKQVLALASKNYHMEEKQNSKHYLNDNEGVKNKEKEVLEFREVRQRRH